MSILILILSLNGNLTTVEIPLKVDVQTCETQSLPNARKRYSRPLIVESAKCFSTEE